MISHVQIELRGDMGWWIHPTGTGTHIGPFDSVEKAKRRVYDLYPMALISIYDPEDD